MDGGPVDRKARLAEIRARHQRNIETLAAAEAAIAQLPQDARDQIALVAQRNERYTLKEFVNYMRSWMSGRNLLRYATLAASLYGTYLMYYHLLHPDNHATCVNIEEPSRRYSNGWSDPWSVPDKNCVGGAGACTIMAPVARNESVVDAVFAKEHRASGRRAASRGVA